MNLTEIYNYALAQDLGVEGKTIFIQNLPAQSGTPALMLKNSLEGTKIDYELPNYRKGRFQAIVRCKANKYEDGEALADLVGISRQTAVLAFQFGEFTTSMIPTSGITVGVLALAKIPWTTWAKWIIPLQLIYMVLALVMLAIACQMGW